jgi:hypothetical protein
MQNDDYIFRAAFAVLCRDLVAQSAQSDEEEVTARADN